MSGRHTSILGGRLLFDDAGMNSDDPIDTVFFRDNVVNNCLHWADEVAQVLGNWSAPDPAFSSASSPQRISETTNADEWGFVTPLGPLSLHVKRSALPYRWRVRLGAASSAGHAVDFALVWGQTLDELQAKVEEGLVDQVRWTGITSTTPAWLTADSGDPFVDLDVGSIVLAIEPTLTDLSGTPLHVGVWEVHLALFARTANKTSYPEVWAFHLAEFI